MPKKKLVNKEAFKKSSDGCYFCGEPDYSTLDVHRINPGEMGGTYHEKNCLPLCANCHRKCHANQIVIDKKYLSSNGSYVLHYWIDGIEHWS